MPPKGGGPDYLRLINDIGNRLQNSIALTRSEIQDFQADHQQADAQAHKYDLRPGELSTPENGAMLVIPKDSPTLAHATYNIGYDR